MSKPILSRFRPQVAGWFEDVFARPTAVQEASWQAISAGSYFLVGATSGVVKNLG